MLIRGPTDRFPMQSLPKIGAPSNGSHAPLASRTEEPAAKRSRQPELLWTHIPCPSRHAPQSGRRRARSGPTDEWPIHLHPSARRWKPQPPAPRRAISITDFGLIYRYKILPVILHHFMQAKSCTCKLNFLIIYRYKILPDFHRDLQGKILYL